MVCENELGNACDKNNIAAAKPGMLCDVPECLAARAALTLA